MENKNMFIRLACITFIMLTAGMFLMVGVYVLPVGRMKNNIAESHETFNYEGIYPQVIQGYKSAQLDNYTDALMFATAIHPGSGHTIKDALYNARYEHVDTSMSQSLNDYANDVGSKEELKYEIQYPRYWHGYLIILKPLLLFFNVSEIRMINMIMQGSLFYILLYLIRRKLGEYYQLPAIAMLLVLNPIVLPLSMQFSWVFYIAILGGIGILLMRESDKARNYIPWFWCIGMLASYMDLLTYPVFTYGLPLIMLLLCANDSWKKQVFHIVKAGMAWGSGYAIMWMGKWIFTWLFGGINIFPEVIAKVLSRTSMLGEGMEELSMLGVLQRNTSVLFKWPYLLLGSLLLVALVLIVRNNNGRRQLQRGIPYAIVMVIPIVWLIVKSNHSWVHYWFTYRELAITVLAVGVGVLECFIKYEERPKEKTRSNFK